MMFCLISPHVTPIVLEYAQKSYSIPMVTKRVACFLYAQLIKAHVVTVHCHRQWGALVSLFVNLHLTMFVH